MTKYRIIKAVAISEDYPFTLQRWDSARLTWEFCAGSCYDRNYGNGSCYGWFKNLKQAKEFLVNLKREEEIKATPPEVVWEEEDE